MFLYALKVLLYEIVSCSECFRQMATDRSFQFKAKSEQLLHRLYENNNRMSLGGLGGNFSCQTSF